MIKTGQTTRIASSTNSYSPAIPAKPQSAFIKMSAEGFASKAAAAVFDNTIKNSFNAESG